MFVREKELRHRVAEFRRFIDVLVSLFSLSFVLVFNASLKKVIMLN